MFRLPDYFLFGGFKASMLNVHRIIVTRAREYASRFRAETMYYFAAQTRGSPHVLSLKHPGTVANLQKKMNKWKQSKQQIVWGHMYQSLAMHSAEPCFLWNNHYTSVLNSVPVRLRRRHLKGINQRGFTVIIQ